MINTQQIAWSGIYNLIKPTIRKYFFKKINAGTSPYMTNMESIAYDEVEKTARQAHILRREDKFPVVQLNGSATRAVKPEVLKDSIPFSAADQTVVQPRNLTLYKGNVVDYRTYERDARLEKLRNSIDAAQEAIATDVFLTGKYKSKQTGDTVTYTFPSTTSITAATDFTNPVMWFSDMQNTFNDDSKLTIGHMLVGQKVFEYIIDKYNVRSNQVEGQTRIRSEKDSDGFINMYIDLFGYTIELLPNGYGVDEKKIDTSKLIYIYNDAAFLPAYAGVTNVTGGKASREIADVLIRETQADEETGYAKTLAESAYCPIVVYPKAIKIFKVTDL